MDKALEKINELKQKLEELYVEKDNIEDKMDIKVGERGTFYRKNEKLYCDVKDLDGEKSNIQYKLTNIKKWKKFTILKTTLIALYFIAMTIFLNLKFIDFSGWGNVLVNMALSACTIPLTVFLGESGSYYYNRKYLKKHKLEDVEKEIEEKQKNISLNNAKIDIFESELNKLNTEKTEIVNKIDLTEAEIEVLESLRSTVINEYIKDNQELDILINNEYEKEQQKQLIKKKDSNK